MVIFDNLQATYQWEALDAVSEKSEVFFTSTPASTDIKVGWKCNTTKYWKL